METSVTRGVLVTGTDTGVGKSLASVVLLHALRALEQLVDRAGDEAGGRGLRSHA